MYILWSYLVRVENQNYYNLFHHSIQSKGVIVNLYAENRASIHINGIKEIGSDGDFVYGLSTPPDGRV